MTESRSGQPPFLLIGRVLGSTGHQGAIRVELLTDFPDNVLRQKTLHVGEELRPYAVETLRVDGNVATVKLAGVDDMATAMALRRAEVSIPRQAAQPLAEGEYFWHDVVGLTVVTDEGQTIGRVTSILRTGANDVYVVATDQGEVLIPVIEQVIVEISPERDLIVIKPMPGLLD
jgi:16S rRNA processing protein RimM